MPEQAKASFFTCRICGHNEFKEVLADFSRDMVVGATIPVKYCKCANCSVVFEDPELFSSTPFNHTAMAAESVRIKKPMISFRNATGK